MKKFSLFTAALFFSFGFNAQTNIEDSVAVVEMFCNTGCWGSLPAIPNMYTKANIAENSQKNDILVECHIYQPYGDWTDIYTLPTNDARYDRYSWQLNILAGLAAVAKNGVRYTPDPWYNCTPRLKKSTAWVNLTPISVSQDSVVVFYTLSGAIGDSVLAYFYVVERGLHVDVTGAENPGKSFDMNNVARAVVIKNSQAEPWGTVSLHLPQGINLNNCRVLSYLQNDNTYEVIGGTKGYNISSLTAENPFPLKRDFFMCPNPASGIININLAQLQDEKNISVEIFSLTGQKVFKKELDHVPSLLQISGLEISPGIYNVRVQTSGGAAVKKLQVY